MNVRCGACRTQFEVAGPGRYACPVCGSVNVVRDGAGAPPPNVGGYEAAPGALPPDMAGGPPPPPPPPPPPMPKVTCPVCDFSFIVGQIAVAECPNCGNEVETGVETPEESVD